MPEESPEWTPSRISSTRSSPTTTPAAAAGLGALLPPPPPPPPPPPTAHCPLPTAYCAHRGCGPRSEVVTHSDS
eukprot:SAG11_NODE_1887_length_4116_cov_8.004730_5_plen_74_part_00